MFKFPPKPSSPPLIPSTNFKGGSVLGGLEDFLVEQEEVGEREREDLVVWLHQVSNNLRQGTQAMMQPGL